MRNVLAENIPDWRCFQVAGRGIYRGVAVGPLADDDPCGPMLAKLVARVAAIARGRHSPAVGAAFLARRAAPMVHQTAQVPLPIAGARALDLRLPARVLHLPGSPMPTALPMRIDEFGAMRAPSILAMTIASYVRLQACSWAPP